MKVDNIDGKIFRTSNVFRNFNGIFRKCVTFGNIKT